MKACARTFNERATSRTVAHAAAKFLHRRNVHQPTYKQPVHTVQRKISCSPAVPVYAALAGASGSEQHGNNQKLNTYLKLARIHNLVPSIILVMVGAWAGSGHRVSACQSISVWLMGLISGGMAIASVVVNDYFDLKIDATNAPHKPLPSGAIAPDAALLLSSLLYCGCLIAACLMEPSGLRSIVAFSAAATLLYTPLFKRLTAIKNATVATVIALAPLAGALAAGAGTTGLLRVLPATLFAFSGVMFREILMDMNDAEGDRQAGVWTLPVLLGKPAALAFSLAFLSIGSGAALYRLLQSPGALAEWFATSPAWAGVQEGLLTGLGLDVTGFSAMLAATAPGAVLGVLLGKLVGLAAGVWRSGFDSAVVGNAVGECLKPVGWGIILLAAMA